MGLISRVSSRTYRNLSLSSTQTLHFVTQVEFRPKRNLFKKNHKKCKKPKSKMSNGISALELKSDDARKILAAIDNPEDVCIVSSKDIGQRATIKCAKFIKGTSMNGRFSPGSFTNHSQAGYREPRLIIVTDPAV